MNARIPIAVATLTAALLLFGGQAEAQKRRQVTTYGGRGIQRDAGYHQRRAPVRIAPQPRRHWVPGHYEWVDRRIWIPGRTERVWMQPVYEWRYDWCGNQYQVMVRAGYWRDVCHPGHYEWRKERVYRPGYWTTDYRRCR